VNITICILQEFFQPFTKPSFLVSLHALAQLKIADLILYDLIFSSILLPLVSLSSSIMSSNTTFTSSRNLRLYVDPLAGHNDALVVFGGKAKHFFFHPYWAYFQCLDVQRHCQGL
jgi:hypothetical protein